MIYNQIEMAHLYLILVLIDKLRLMIKDKQLLSEKNKSILK